jgi:anti-sigma regulatory factor (Ser/Thr protein kinase)
VDPLTSGEDVEWIWVEDTSAPGRVRGVATALARRLGFTDHRVGEVAIAATELGTNLQRHARGGTMLVRVHRSHDQAAVELVATDTGPGIADLALISRDGESTAGTLGIGIGAIRRAASFFDAHSVVGRGTVMTATFWPGPSPNDARPSIAGLTRPMQNEMACGDAWSVRVDGRVTTLLLADGLGHGELAAMASRTAVRHFLSQPGDNSPATVLQQLDAVMRTTRGAAVAVIALNALTRTLTFAGVGNVAVWVDDGERRQGLHSTPGIAGNHPKRVREVELPMHAGAVAIMHSDGLTSKWDLRSYPGVVKHDATLIAATLLRDAGIHHDDASIVVAKI